MGFSPIPSHFFPLRATIGSEVPGVNVFREKILWPFRDLWANVQARITPRVGTKISRLRILLRATSYGWARERVVATASRKRESAGKPGSVVGNHSSGMHVAVHLKRPTRKLTRVASRSPAAACFPIWPCSRRGLPCHQRYRWRGALLPHRFTLAVARWTRAWAVCFLLHFPWAHAPQVLPGASPCGARTFLCFPLENSGCLADSRGQHRGCAAGLQGARADQAPRSSRARA